MLKNMWRIAGKVFLVAVVLDLIYQITVLHGIHPFQTLIVAILLALVPCVIVRGIGNRIVSMAHAKRSSANSEASRTDSNETPGKSETAQQPDNVTGIREDK